MPVARTSHYSRTELAAAFVGVLRRYWLGVFPHARKQIRYWRRRARLVEDPFLRAVAIEAQDAKSGNLECAAVYALFAPSRYRLTVTQSLVTFQAIYDYLDLLAEQPSTDLIANGNQLHQALLAAVTPDRPLLDYYAHSRHRDDGGYLREMIESCRTGFAGLPSSLAVGRALRTHVERMIMFQSLNHGDRNGTHDGFIEWARKQTPAHAELHWWEVAAAAGSSLPVLAAIAAAADPDLSQREADAIEDTYYPWIAALNTLLDSLVDQREDSAPGQNRLLDYYLDSAAAAQRIHMVAERANEGISALPRGPGHAVVLAAMIAYYLSNPEADAPQAKAASGLVMTAMGGLATPAMLTFRARRAMALPRLLTTGGSTGHRRGHADLRKRWPVRSAARGSISIWHKARA
jgi:tetraprenyl-beta-curcumene synthase